MCVFYRVVQCVIRCSFLFGVCTPPLLVRFVLAIVVCMCIIVVFSFHCSVCVLCLFALCLCVVVFFRGGAGAYGFVVVRSVFDFLFGVCTPCCSRFLLFV